MMLKAKERDQKDCKSKQVEFHCKNKNTELENLPAHLSKVNK